jgi:phage terminase large subunit
MTAIMGYEFSRAGMKGQILCGREFMNSLEDSSFYEVKSAIEETPWLNEFYDCGDKYIRTKDKKITYTFSGLRHSIDSIKSKSRILLAWIDEAEQVSDAAWLKLIPTVREEGSEIWVTWNPELKNSATDTRFRKQVDDSMKIVELNYRDNPWFPSVLEEERKRDKVNNPELYDHIWEGKYLEYRKGTYFKEQIQKAEEEGRIINLPILDSQPCLTFWDIGNSDGTAIWVVQRIGKEFRLINFYEAWGKPYSHAVKWLQDTGYIFEAMFLPHDASHERQGKHNNKSPQTMLEELMPSLSWEIVPRIADINWGIQQVRDVFPMLWFNKQCIEGIDHIKAYKRKWSENERRWLDRPDKSEGHSEAADALRQLAQAYSNGQLDIAPVRERKQNYRGASGWMM